MKSNKLGSVAPQDFRRNTDGANIEDSRKSLSRRFTDSLLSLRTFFNKNPKIVSGSMPDEVTAGSLQVQVVIQDQSTEDATRKAKEAYEAIVKAGFRGFKSVVERDNLQEIAIYLANVQRHKVPLVDQDGSSFLHMAVEMQSKKAVEEVLKLQKDLIPSNKNGKTPLDIAKQEEKSLEGDNSKEIMLLIQSSVKERNLSNQRKSSRLIIPSGTVSAVKEALPLVVQEAHR
jgi:ankyrin repeat protein